MKRASNMYKSLMNIKKGEICKICKEGCPDSKIGPRNKMCKRCSNEKKNTKNIKIFTFSKENDMHPDEVPECIKILSSIELASIRMIQPMFHVYQTKGGGLKMRGNTIALEQDISEFASRLPHSPDKLPLLILLSRNVKNPRKVQANGNNILKALQWLKLNNPFYKNIEIDHAALEKYPETGGNVDGIPEEFLDDKAVQNDPKNPSMRQQDIDEINEVLQNDIDISNDIPPPISTLQQNYSKPTILESMKKLLIKLQ